MVRTPAELRAIIGQPHAKVAQKITPQLDAYQVAFIGRAPLAFVATADEHGNTEVSPKGDHAGFVHVFGDRTLLIPERPGNKLAYGFENILCTGRIALIFTIPGVIETLRIGGRAQVSRDPELLARLAVQGKPALLCTIVTVEKCWFHCGKALIRSRVWQPETWQTDASCHYTEQVAQAIRADAEVVKRVVQDDYANNLY